MKLTKDEARILAYMVREQKFEMKESIVIPKLMDKLIHLEKRLFAAGEDSRRNGRTSMDSFTDCLKRFANK